MIATTNEIVELQNQAVKEFADKLKKCLHEEDFNTPDERWKPESDFAAIIDALLKEYEK